MKTMLRPLARTPRSTSNRRCTSGGDRAEVGSSRMTMRAPENSTRASSISCCRPIASEPMRAPRIDVDAEVGEMPARTVDHGAPVDDAAARRLLAEIDVLGHREVGHDAQLLVHHADAGRQRLARRAEMHRPAVDRHAAVVLAVQAGDDLHQGRLAGAVLAHQAVDLAGAQHEVDVAQGRDAAERLGDAASVRQPRRAARASTACRRTLAGMTIRSGSDPASTACRRRSPWSPPDRR